MTCIILVRHGQTDWNREERFRGQLDVPLNKTGLAQARTTGRWVAKKWQPVAIYSGPLSRTVKTAEQIASHFSLPVLLHQGLIDINYGEWQGLTPDEVRERWPDELHTWYTQPEKATIPGGESLVDMRARGMDAVNEIAPRYPEQTIVLVSHNAINRIILLGILGLPNDRYWHIKQENCAINVFDVDNNDFTLETMNNTFHIHEQ